MNHDAEQNIDRGKAPERIGFGGDPRRQYFCEQLIFLVIWNNYDLAPGDLDVLRLATDVFPSLAAYQEPAIVAKAGMSFQRVAVGLLEVGDHQGALDFLNVVADTLPSDFILDEDHLIPLSEALLQISAHYQKLIPSLAKQQKWEGSLEQHTLNHLLDAVQRVDVVTQGKAYSPVNSHVLAKLLYKANDLMLFEKILYSPQLRLDNPGAFIGELDDIWKPAIAGNMPLQVELLRHLVEFVEGEGRFNSNNVILSFWRGADDYVRMLKISGELSDWQEAFNQATSTFNIDSVQGSKTLIVTKQLFPMLAGISQIALAARNAGVPLSPAQYRLVLKPLEKIAEVAGRMWIPHMGSQYAPMKSATTELFKDLAPNDLSKRPLPKHLASALSDVLGNTRWIGQATKRDRGQILTDDLGL